MAQTEAREHGNPKGYVSLKRDRHSFIDKGRTQTSESLIRVETHTQPDVCLVIQQQPLSR